MSEIERRKDLVQDAVQSTAGLVGRITVIVTDAVAAIAREIGDTVTDGIEMREAASRARRAESGDGDGDGAPGGAPGGSPDADGGGPGA